MHPFAIDTRSLSLFRICLGGVALLYWFTHWQVFETFHSAEKAVPSDVLQTYYGLGWKWSLNWLSDSSAYQYFLLGCGIVASGCLIVGRHTKVATFASWLLVASFNNNAPLIASGGDALLCALLFWGFFLPINFHWSWDRRSVGAPLVKAPLVKASTVEAEPDGERQAAALLTVATVGILLQMAMMYFCTGISKCNEYWFNGSALGITFTNETYVRPLGIALRELPWLTNLMSRGTLVGELLFPFLLFSPWKPLWCRSVALLGLMGLHVGIELTMRVIIFSFVSFAGLMLFIPSRWWEALPLQKLQQLLEPFDESSQPQQSRQQRRQEATQAGLWEQTRLQRQVLLVGVIVYMFCYNMFNAFASPATGKKYAAIHQPASLLALNQSWIMFNYPPALCSHIACIGRLRDGSFVDLLREGSVVTDRKQPPTEQLGALPTRVWNALIALSRTENKIFREYFLRHLSNKWRTQATNKDQEVIEAFLTFYPQEHHPLAEIQSQDLFHLDLLSEGKLIYGERHGPWVLYHENGQKMSEGNYERGKAVGKWTFWEPDGSLSAEGTMQRGKPSGKWKHYKDGEMQVIDHSASGQPPPSQ